MGIFGIVGNASDGNLAGYGRYEPKRQNLFTVEFSALVSGSPLDTLLNAAGASLTHTVQTVGAIGNEITPITLKHGNDTWQIAGRSRSGQDTIELSFHDIIPSFQGDSMDAYPQYSASAIFYDWQNIIQNVHTADGGLAGDYKGNIFVKQYGPNQQIIEQWMIHGVFPTGIAGTENTYESEDGVKTIAATFSLDKIYRLAIDDTAEPTEVQGIIAER
jgi:hypothetical protein